MTQLHWELWADTPTPLKVFTPKGTIQCTDEGCPGVRAVAFSEHVALEGLLKHCPAHC